MATTPRPVLRERILEVLLADLGRTLTRKQVLDRLRTQYETAWTEGDVSPQPSRPFESRWENAASFERADMVRDGLLESGGDKHWVLTATGVRAARGLNKQLQLIDDVDVDNRGYADLRAGQLLLGRDDHEPASDESEPAQDFVQLERIDSVPPEVLAAAVPLEAAQTFAYGVHQAGATEAMKTEAGLVDRFMRSLLTRGHRVGRFKIGPIDGSEYLYTDIFDVTENCLYEAKADASRESVRMAIGQLMDYGRHISPAPSRALLVPERPTPDLLELLQTCGIACVSEEANGFETADA